MQALRTTFLKEHLWWLLLHHAKSIAKNPVTELSFCKISSCIFIEKGLLHGFFPHYFLGFYRISEKHIWVTIFLLIYSQSRNQMPKTLAFPNISKSLWYSGRRSQQRCFMKKAVLKYFAIFTGKRLYWIFFLIKLL